MLAAVLSLLLLPPAVAMDEADGIDGDMLVANVQMELNDYGYDAGPEDGVLGLVTVSAICHFQADQGLPVTGRTDEIGSASCRERERPDVQISVVAATLKKKKRKDAEM